MRQITLIAQLYEARSVVHAAEATGISQPAASALLKGFEEALEVRLFDRHARGVTPTAYGELLVRHARAILSELDQVQDGITALKSGLSGSASIGTVTTPAVNLVPQAVARLKQNHPEVLVDVTVDASHPLVEKLLEGQLDMVVARILDSRGLGELQFEPLAEEKHAVVSAGNHPLARVTGLKLADLLRHPWILPPPGSVLRDQMASVFLLQGLHMPTNIVQTQSFTAILGLLEAMDAVVPLPPETVQPLCKSGLLAILIEDVGVGMSPFGIITRRKHKMSPAAQALLDSMRATARTLYLSPLAASAAGAR